MDRKRHLKPGAVRGRETVDNTAPVGLMNLHLHGIDRDESPIKAGNSFEADPGDRFSTALSNPPPA